MRWCVFLLLLAAPLRADPVHVVTDIAPVHDLVRLVMGHEGDATALIPAGASPHDHTMRPSEARALSRADLVIWVGPALTGWLAEPLETLAPDAEHLVLLDVPGTHLLSARENVGFEGQGHDHDHDHGDAHADGPAVDPHAWLDPRNGGIWAIAIAEALGRADPDNAARYLQRGQLAQRALNELDVTLATMLEPHKQTPFIVLHDAFQYFEHRYDLTAVAAVTASDASAPGPARITALRGTVARNPVRCAFAEPAGQTDILGTVLEGQAYDIVRLDPMRPPPGRDGQPYEQMLTAMAEAMAGCLSRN